MRVLFLEVIRECEGDNRETSIVVGTSLARVVRRFALLVRVIALLPVDIADLVVVSKLVLGSVSDTYAAIPARMLQRATEQSSVCKRVFHYAPVPSKAQMNEIVVLRDDLRSRSGEVQSVGLLCSAQIVQLKHQMLGQVALVSPDDPSNTSIDQPEFVSTDVDRLDAGKLKVPLLACLGMRERSNERTGSALEG